jgi:hypothetical protein
VVAVDGPDAGEGAACARDGAGLDLRVLTSDEPAGPAAARNRAFEVARGEMTLLLNDDVVPDAACLARHAAARAEVGPHDMVLGSAPFRVEADDRLFDRLVRETSMVFFYDQMTPAKVGAAGWDDPSFRGHDWGFRHAWTLNLTLPTEDVRAVGGFTTALPGAAFEDVELAWRLRERFASRVIYRPEAIVEHDHRYEPEGYLERERALGRDAWALAGVSAGCARELFGRDIRSDEEVAYSRAFVARERATVARLESSFRGLVELPAGSVGGAHGSALLELVYQQHVVLKRWYWRSGLLEAAGADVVVSPAV